MYQLAVPHTGYRNDLENFTDHKKKRLGIFINYRSQSYSSY